MKAYRDSRGIAHTNKTGSVVWSGSIDVDEERRTSSANFLKENI